MKAAYEQSRGPLQHAGSRCWATPVESGVSLSQSAFWHPTQRLSQGIPGGFRGRPGPRKSRGCSVVAAGIAVFSLLLGLATASAQEIIFAAQPDRTEITSDESLKLTVSVFGREVDLASEPQLPPMPDFRMDTLFRLNTTHYAEEGERNTKIYTYVLTPLTSGTLIIDPIRLRVGQKTLRTDRIVIEVTPGSGKTPERPRADTGLDARGRLRETKDIFTRSQIDKRKAYIFEQVTFTFEFYNRYDLFGDPSYVPPETPGFWVEELPSDKLPRGKAIDGRVFDVQTIRSALFATSPGPKTIGATTLETSYSIDQGSSASVVLSTNPIEIEVLPFPQVGKPKSFDGAVGVYTISAEVDNEEVQVGDPISLRVKVEGVGNVRTISAVHEPPLDDFRTYEPKVTQTSTNSGYAIQGSKSFEYVLIPKSEGTSIIGPFLLAFFDPQREQYEEAATEPISIVAVRGVFEEARTGAEYRLSREEIKQVGKDIRYIKADVDFLEDQGKRLYNDEAFLIVQAFPILAFFGALAYRRRLRKLKEDEVSARQRRARNIADRHLKEAQRLMAEGTPEAFYGTIHRTLSEFLEGKLGVPVAGMTTEQLSAYLAGRNITSEEIESIKAALDQCDFARFAPLLAEGGGISTDEKAAILARAHAIINQLERET